VIGQALAGGPIRLGATTPVRDLTFVTDTVEGFIAAAEAPGLEGGVFNLGTGVGASVGEVARMILRIMGVKSDIELDPKRLRPAKSEVDRLISSNGAFAAAAGWRPRVQLEEGLRRTVAFFRDFPELLPRSEYVV
jgi:nucleoside-diphosphate-sugar epimerase